MSRLSVQDQYQLSYLISRSRSLVDVLSSLANHDQEIDNFPIIIEIVAEYLLEADKLLSKSDDKEFLP